MKRNFLVASIFFLISGFIGNNAYLIASVKEDITNKKIDLNKSYLKENIPLNDYILGPGDQLYIVVSRDYQELNSAATIDGEGTIFLPKLKRVYVAGLTLNELISILNEAFLEFVKFPSVEVSMIRYRPIRVFVQGEVANPGLQTLQGSLSLLDPSEVVFDINRVDIDREEIIGEEIIGEEIIGPDYMSNISQLNSNEFYFPTVFDAIRASGGITSFSDLSNIQIIRENNLSNGSGKVQTILNFEDVLETGNSLQNIRIYDQDIIKVRKTKNPDNIILRKAMLTNLNPKFINVLITGRVKLPGNTRVSRASTLSDAIDIAGGAKVLRGPVTFLRFNNDGNFDKRKFAYRKNAKRGSYKNPYLRTGDLIVVGESAMSNLNSIITEFTTPFVGIFSTYGMLKALTD